MQILDSFKRVSAFFYKESLQALRDPSVLYITFIFPVVMLFLMGYAVSLDPKLTRVGVLSSSKDSSVSKFVQTLDNTDYFNAVYSDNIDELKKYQYQSNMPVIVSLPQDFSKKIAKKEAPTIQIISDGSEVVSAQLLSFYVRTLFNQYLADEGIRPKSLIKIDSRFWFNKSMESKNLMVPSSLVVILNIIGTLLTALVVAREYERGTLEAILATPLTKLEFIIAKILPYFVLGITSAALCLFYIYAWFDITPVSGYLTPLLICAVYLIPSLAQGLAISAVTKNQFVASTAAILAGFLPAIMLSGFIYEINSMPDWLQTLTHAFAGRFFLTAFNTAYTAGNVYELIIPNIIYMLTIALVFIIISNRVTKSRLQ